MMIPIVRGPEGTSYDQEGGTPISASKKVKRQSQGFRPSSIKICNALFSELRKETKVDQ